MKTVLLQLLLVVALVVGSVSVTAAQWTTVGSTGSVDEGDLATSDMSGFQVRIRSAATLPAAVVVRYNVVAAEGVMGGNGIVLNARYRDNGPGAHILAVLRQVNITTGVTTTLLTFDSNSFAQLPGFQAQGVSDCGPVFDFSTSAYFVETTITKASADGAPALQALQAGFIICL
jgi:hypothetical protein